MARWRNVALLACLWLGCWGGVDTTLYVCNPGEESHPWEGVCYVCNPSGTKWEYASRCSDSGLDTGGKRDFGHDEDIDAVVETETVDTTTEADADADGD